MEPDTHGRQTVEVTVRWRWNDYTAPRIGHPRGTLALVYDRGRWAHEGSSFGLTGQENRLLDQFGEPRFNSGIQIEPGRDGEYIALLRPHGELTFSHSDILSVRALYIHQAYGSAGLSFMGWFAAHPPVTGWVKGAGGILPLR